MKTFETVEQIQRVIAKVIARNPAGNRLILIGGFRYRLLDDAPRVSEVIDYHWPGAMDDKQQAVIELIRRIALPQIKSLTGYDGRVDRATGPDAESPSLRVINTAFWQEGIAHSRIEIPVEITRIECLDEPIVRTVKGVVYATPTDQDMIESKLLALLNRRVVRERDFVDVFLFADCLTNESVQRIAKKIDRLNVTMKYVSHRISFLHDNESRFIKGIQTVLNQQVQPATVAQLEVAGGAGMIFRTVMGLLNQYIPIDAEGMS